ncbi:MAG: hypothetical protein KDJ75_03200 [Alphaproteobacteria bacterium]|nr:hypothetical protein [Alphaproteobacteria bacterium]
MTTHLLLQTLGLSGDSDFGDAAARFSYAVKEMAAGFLDEREASRADQQERAVEMLYAEFFRYAATWVENRQMAQTRNKNSEELPAARPIKAKAADIRNALEEHMLAFLRCYIFLNRSILRLRTALEECEAPEGEKGIRWSPDTGVLLGRFRRERQELEASNDDLTQGHAVLKGVEPYLNALEEQGKKLFGEKNAESALRSFRAGIRTGDFKRADTALKTLEQLKPRLGADKTVLPSLREGALRYLETVARNKDLLTGPENKLYMKSAEINVLLEAQKREILKKTEFIRKYRRAYMEHKISALEHLKEKLLIPGSLESLTTLYIRMIRGLAEPMTDMALLREYEEEVVERIDYLLSGPLGNTGEIRQRGLELLDEFEKGIKEFEEGETQHAGL